MRSSMFLVSFHCPLHISKSSRLPPLGISNPTYSATILHWGSSVSPFLTFACTVVFFFKISREAHENWASVSFIGSVYHERLSSWHKPLVLCSPRWYHNVRFNCRLLLWTAGFRQTRSLAHSSLVLGAAHGKEKTTLYLLKNRFPSGKHFHIMNIWSVFSGYSGCRDEQTVPVSWSLSCASLRQFLLCHYLDLLVY